MTVLREYLRSAAGTFTSPNHPTPQSGSEVIARLDQVADPSSGMTSINPLDMTVEIKEEPSGDRWIYVHEDQGVADAPLLIEHPDIPAP